MKGKLIWSVFWGLVGVFILIVGIMISPPWFSPSWHRVYIGILSSVSALLLLLGITFLVLTIKSETNGVFRKFQLLTGASAVGLPISILLHNVVSALLNVEEPVFFMIAVFVCPLGFLVGAVGTIVINIRSKQVKQSS